MKIKEIKIWSTDCECLSLQCFFIDDCNNKYNMLEPLDYNEGDEVYCANYILDGDDEENLLSLGWNIPKENKRECAIDLINRYLQDNKFLIGE